MIGLLWAGAAIVITTGSIWLYRRHRQKHWLNSFTTNQDATFTCQADGLIIGMNNKAAAICTDQSMDTDKALYIQDILQNSHLKLSNQQIYIMSKRLYRIAKGLCQPWPYRMIISAEHSLHMMAINRGQIALSIISPEKTTTSVGIWSHLPYPAFYCDNQGSILARNIAFLQSALHQTDYNNVCQYLPIHGVELKKLLQKNQQHDDWSNTEEWLWKPSEKQELHVILRILCVSAGQFLICIEDQQSVQRLRRQLQQSQKMQAIGQLAGGIAHDFNNILTAISGHCEFLQSSRTTSDPDFHDLAQIQDNVWRASRLVKQILAFARQQNIEFQRINLPELIAGFVRMIERTKPAHITITVSTPPNSGDIYADSGQLEQILLNLFNNACHAMPEQGCFAIATSHITAGDPILGAEHIDITKQDYVLIQVRDNGTGMDEQTARHVFEPFFTTKSQGEGTGLGLAMVYGCIKQMGGYIFLDTKLGEGCCFRIYLPRYQAAQKETVVEKTAHTAPALCDNRNHTILLIEDEVSVRQITARALRLHGFEVTEAGNGQEGITHINDNLEQNGKNFSLIICDMMMPVMNGADFLKALRAKGLNTAVLFISGYAQDQLHQEVIDDAHSQLLCKPFSLQSLIKRIQEVL